ncbi:endonuclease III [bacterium]|nr:endonuclease III [bacterium]
MTKKERFKLFVDYFEEHMPVAETELNYSNGFELLVAVILSAQCTDKRVNQVTPALFQAFPVPEVMALSSQDEIFHYIRSVSYPNNKSKHLVGMANMLVNDFNSEVPKTVDELQLLPGVGRKTANVVASVLFDVPTMPVDTHVFRVSERVGLTTKAKNPLESEKQLLKGFPKNKLKIAHHWLILHGRYVCLARTPKCNECGISSFCSYFKKNN